MIGSLGLVIPVFNEEKRLDPEYFRNLALIPEIQLLFVNDASTDQTLDVITKIATSIENVSVVSLSSNVGKGNAIRHGWSCLVHEHELDFIGFLDADGAFKISDIYSILKKAQENLVLPSEPPKYHARLTFDAIWSSRIQLSGRNITRSKKRYFLGRIFATLIKFSFSKLPWDTQSGFKIFKNSSIISRAYEDKFHCRWLFDIELLLRIYQISDEDYVVWEEPISTWHDVTGSKLNMRGYLVALKDFFFLVLEHKLRKEKDGQKKRD